MDPAEDCVHHLDDHDYDDIDDVEDDDDVFASKANDTSISCPAGHDKSSVSNSQATSSMAENTGVITSAPLIRSYYLPVLYLECWW